MASRGDKRREAREEKRLSDLAKTHRQFDLASGKIPKSEKVYPTKRAVTTPIRNLKLKWTDRKADREGNWSWGNQPRNWSLAEGAQIKNFLRNCAEKTWLEIETETTGQEGRRRAKHTKFAVGQIKKEARDRLDYMGLEDVESLFRFRLAGRFRLWGRKIENLFSVLWHDPTHKIYND